MKSTFIFSGEAIRLPKGASIPVTLKVLEFELFHFCPIQVRHHNQPMLYVTGYLNFSASSFVILTDVMFYSPGNSAGYIICSNRPNGHVQHRRSCGRG